MAVHAVPTTEARRDINKILKRFRSDGPTAQPVLFGAHRRPEAVILPYDAYAIMQDLIEDAVIAAQVRERDRRDDGTRFTVDEIAAELGLPLDQ